jgi:hypothetical protein
VSRNKRQGILPRRPWPSLFLSVLAASPSASAGPATGRYEALLCVTNASQAPNCGPVTVELRAAGVVLMKVSDIVYDLKLHSSQVDVVLKHGAMQIDWFTANYEWQGDELHFFDAEKRVRYAVHLGRRQQRAN